MPCLGGLERVGSAKRAWIHDAAVSQSVRECPREGVNQGVSREFP